MPIPEKNYHEAKCPDRALVDKFLDYVTRKEKRADENFESEWFAEEKDSSEFDGENAAKKSKTSNYEQSLNDSNVPVTDDYEDWDDVSL
jgi:hypothetical protein